MFRVAMFALSTIVLLGRVTLTFADDTLNEQLDQAGAARSEQRYEDAMRLYREVLPQLHGQECLRDRLMALYNLGTIERVYAPRPHAEQHLREALALGLEAYGPQSAIVGQVLKELARISLADGKLEAAEAEARDALKILEVNFGAADEETVRAVATLATLYGMTEKWAEAEPFMRRQLVYDLANPRNEASIPLAQCDLGATLFALNKFEEARSLLKSGYTGRRTPMASKPTKQAAQLSVGRAARFASCAYIYAGLLAFDDNKSQAIEPLRVALAFYGSNEARFGKTLGGVLVDLADALRVEAVESVPYDRTLLTEAKGLAEKGLLFRRKFFHEEDVRIAQASYVLGMVLYALTDMPAAEEHLTRAALYFRTLAAPGDNSVKQENAVRVLIDLSAVLQAQEKWPQSRASLTEALSRAETLQELSPALVHRAKDMFARSREREAER